MKIHEFLRQLPRLVNQRLEPELRPAHMIGPYGGILKWHFGDARVHYEVWVQPRLGIIEIGLHFEKTDPQANAQHLSRIASRFQEVHRGLGATIEPEQWTRSWTRVHESVPFTMLDNGRARHVARRVAQMIAVLEPIVREPL